MPRKSGQNYEPGYNPICLEYELMSDEELGALFDDIKRSGLKNGIQLDADRLVLDGRNRIEACLRNQRPDLLHKPGTGKPWFIKWRGEASDERYRLFCYSVNDARRHDADRDKRKQRAIAIAKCFGTLPAWRPVSKKINSANGRLSDCDSGSETQISTKKGTIPSVQEQAEMAGVSPRTMHRVHKELTDDELFGTTEQLGTTIVEPEQPKDRLGHVIPAHTLPYWQTAKKFRKWSKQIKKINEEFDVLFRSRLDRRATAWIEGSSVARAMSELVRVLHSAEPYAVCPICADKPERCDKNAQRSCLGTGWFPKGQYATIPEAAKWKC